MESLKVRSKARRPTFDVSFDGTYFLARPRKEGIDLANERLFYLV